MKNLYSFVSNPVLIAYNAAKEISGATNGRYQKRMETIQKFFEEYDKAVKLNAMLLEIFWIMLVKCLCVTKLTGKLTGFFSLSTSPLLNKFCEARKKCDKLICKHCFSIKQLDNVIYKALMLCLETNSIILNNILIPTKYLAMVKFNAPLGYGRIESHGDVATVTCAMNYINFVIAHPDVLFTVWSKNLAIWDKAFRALGKPENLTYTFSSEKVNEMSMIPKEYQWFIDHRFTCYDIDYAKAHNIKINCGHYDSEYREISHRCKHCMLCYDKKNLAVFDIFELVKGEKPIKKAPKKVREAFLKAVNKAA